MSNDFYLRSVTGEDSSSFDVWAVRILNLLARLREVDATLFGNWYLTASSKRTSLASPVALDQDFLRALLEKERVRNDRGGLMPDLGTSIGFWNGLDSAPVGIDLVCGAHGYGLPNEVRVKLGPGRAGAGPDSVPASEMAPILEAVVRSMEPGWATIASDEHAWKAQARLNPFMSWYVYVHGNGLSKMKPTPGVTPRRLGELGWVLSLPAPVDPGDEQAVKAAAEIDKRIGACQLDLPVIPRP